MRTPKLNSAQEQEVLALYKHVKVAELAARFGVSGGTIVRVLHRHGAMRPRNGGKDEIRIIRRLSGKRTQRELATLLGRSVTFVKHWQRKLGCERKHEPTEADKKIIIKLYREGKGQARIAKITGVPQAKVRRTLLEAGVQIHGTGGVPTLTPEKRQKAVAMIRAKGAYLKDIAKKLGLNRACIEKLAHAILGCERFFGGAIWPPLQSAFPEMQRHDERCTVGDYMKLLNAIFPTGLPPSAPDSTVVPVVIDLLMTTFPFWRTAPTPILQTLENNLVAAMTMMRGAEQALVN